MTEPDTYTLSSGAAAKAELRELREERDRWAKTCNEWADTHVENCGRINELLGVADELAEALRRASIEASACSGCARPIYWAEEVHAPSCRIGTVLARYEALRDG